uniref:BZIP domain-containing protein n=1 Tax=Mola mola TaxID=94237 RepID=A0A3Q3WLY9_MOLML
VRVWRGMKRKEKNRDAARKSRRKQTERADELHECLEQSNLALEKEVASLKTELDIYTMALERHEPFCCLQGPAHVGAVRGRLFPRPDRLRLEDDRLRGRGRAATRTPLSTPEREINTEISAGATVVTLERGSDQRGTQQ